MKVSYGLSVAWATSASLQTSERTKLASANLSEYEELKGFKLSAIRKQKLVLTTRRWGVRTQESWVRSPEHILREPEELKCNK